MKSSNESFVPVFPNRRVARFSGDRSICAVVIDAEEDFDWIAPIQGTRHSTENMKAISVFQELCDAYEVIPTYLLTFPILEEPEIIYDLKELVAKKKCDVGIQLHPWVTPPFSHANLPFAHSERQSFAGNLPPDLEERKLLCLIGKFRECFEIAPSMFRAGRYGLSSRTPAFLDKYGFTVDTSVAPLTDFSAAGGPNYKGFNFEPFWFGERGKVLEIPLCRDVVGRIQSVAHALYRLGSTSIGQTIRLHTLCSSLHFAERITLSPEGNDLAALRRLASCLASGDSKLFVISFHSSSLTIGLNPYVSSLRDWRFFYDRLSGILNYLNRELNVKFVKLADLPHLYAEQ